MNGEWVLAAAAVLTILGGAVVVVYRIIRDGQIMRAFVKDVARNHLPHIDHCLNLIATKLDIEIPEPPPIRFVDFSERD